MLAINIYQQIFFFTTFIEIHEAQLFRKENILKVSFGAKMDKTMECLVRIASNTTWYDATQRKKLIKTIERIKKAPFDTISYSENGDTAKFEFLSQYSVHRMQKDTKTGGYIPKVTFHEMVEKYEVKIPKGKNAATKLLDKLSDYLSFWDEY